MCRISSSAIAADGQAVDAALNSIAAIEQATNPTLASQLTEAGKALVTATANWQTGTPADDINTAATAIEAVLAAIPMTAPYAEFVAIAVAALDAIIGNLTTQTTQTGDAVSDLLKVRTAIRALPENPYRGLVTVHPHVLQTFRGALKDRWNEQVDIQPSLGVSKIA